MATVRYQPGSRVFDNIIKSTLEETRQHMIALAHREHRKIVQADPRPAAWQQYVDGRAGAPFESVKGNGVIVIDYDRLSMAVQFALDTLLDLSPVLSGAYSRAHTVFVNGTPSTDPADWNNASEVIISNTVEYARKIELGTMSMRVSGTDHVYTQAEQIVRRRMGAIADVRFTYRGFIGGGVATGRAHGKSDRRFPALIMAPAGTLGRRRRH